MKTQRQRRIVYGLNIVIAAVVALALVVFLNWIIDRTVRRNLSPQARQWLRYDLTSTRRYSLSQQTLRVLRDLEQQYRVVTLFSQQGAYIDQAKDLIDEYATYSDNVSVEHVHPALEYSKAEAFHSSLLERYQDDLKPARDSIEQGRAVLQTIADRSEAMGEPLRQMLDDPALQREELRQFIASASQIFSRYAQELTLVQEQVQTALDEALPNYAGARTNLQNLLSALDEGFFAILIQRFQQAAEREDTPASIKDRMLRLVEELSTTRKEVQQALAAVRDAQTPEAYDQLRNQLARVRNAVVVVGPDQVQVLNVSDLFRAPEIDPGAAVQTEPELQFLGEEKITGTLVSMELAHRPLVVFVSSGQMSPLGQGSPHMTYNRVADRLRNMNFEVQSWSPGPQMNPMTGQPGAPQPIPEPAEGQKAVWIILPGEPPNPMNPMSAMGSQEVARLAEDRLDAGDGIMVMLMAQPMMFGMGGENPLASLLNNFGITAQLDRVVMREMVLPDRRRTALPQHEINDWPQTHPITQALAGARAMLAQASPLAYAQQDAQDTIWPLVRISGREVWAETDLMNAQQARRDESEETGPFVLAVAAAQGEQRLVAVADPIWATDYITGFGIAGPETAALAGAMFPGNAELFVNSVYWLAELDQLIAAGARTQDIRRVDPMSPGSFNTLRWMLLAGLPLAVAAAGVGVWLARRA